MNDIIKISNAPAAARVMSQCGDDGTSIVNQLEGVGLVIGKNSISFPDYLLNSVTWVACWNWEMWVTDSGSLDATDRGEIRVWKRLRDRLKEMGGVDVLEYEDGVWKNGCGPDVVTEPVFVPAPAVAGPVKVDEGMEEETRDDKKTMRFRVSSEAWETGIEAAIIEHGGKYSVVKTFGLDGRKVDVILDRTAIEWTARVAFQLMIEAEGHQRRGMWKRVFDNVCRNAAKNGLLLRSLLGV